MSLFRTFFRSASIGVKVIDLETMHLVDANPSFQHMLGYSLPELCGRPYVEFTHPDDVERERILQLGIADGSSDTFSLVKRFVRKDGSEVRARVTTSVVRDAARKPRYAFSMVEDIGGSMKRSRRGSTPRSATA